METAIIISLVLIALFLASRWWFWAAAFGIGGLASAFATLASIFHFQILGALGFCFLAMVCFAITNSILDY